MRPMLCSATVAATPSNDYKGWRKQRAAAREADGNIARWAIFFFSLRHPAG
jgi:hypothetical protein